MEAIHNFFSNKFFIFQNGKIVLKCSAILGDFFLKSEEIVIQDRRTKFREIEGKSESEPSEKILGLFDENFYRDEDIPQSFSSDVDIRKSYNFLIVFLISFILQQQV